MKKVRVLKMSTATIAEGVSQRAERKLKEILESNNAKLTNYSTRHVYDPNPKPKDKMVPTYGKGLSKDKSMSVAEYACLALREKYNNK